MSNTTTTPGVPTHPFQPVKGHPGDDECTHRKDGADATYCGLQEHDHAESLR